jgi:16S rRNA processing protein RimM
LNAPTIVGTVTDVLEGGAGYLLEVSISESCNCISEELKKTSSGKPRTVLIPFNNEHVGKVDVKKGTIQLMHLWILE